MSIEYPDWATEKQKEGMKIFHNIADEYLSIFRITFKHHDYDPREFDHSFITCLDWNNNSLKGERHHEMHIAWDYEKTWDRYGDEIHDWQFIFSGGDASREISTEVLFVDLFCYLDAKLDLNQIGKHEK